MKLKLTETRMDREDFARTMIDFEEDREGVENEVVNLYPDRCRRRHRHHHIVRDILHPYRDGQFHLISVIQLLQHPEEEGNDQEK